MFGAGVEPRPQLVPPRRSRRVERGKLDEESPWIEISPKNEGIDGVLSQNNEVEGDFSVSWRRETLSRLRDLLETQRADWNKLRSLALVCRVDGELQLKPPAGIQAVFDFPQAIQKRHRVLRSNGGDGGDETGRPIAVRELLEHIENGQIERRLAHPGELDLEFFDWDNSIGKTAADHEVELFEHLFPRPQPGTLSACIAHEASDGASLHARDREHPLPLSRQRGLQ